MRRKMKKKSNKKRKIYRRRKINGISTIENVEIGMKGNPMVATTQRAESIANVIPNHQSNKPTASEIHHHQHGQAHLISKGY